jgi:hypothetical protein
VRHVRMLGMCLIAAFAFSAVAATGAWAKTKLPSLKPLANCPVEGHAENGLPAELCVYGETTPKEGGQFTVGPITVPLANSIKLQYGLAIEQVPGEPEYYIPPTHGAPAITPTPERVPGEPIAHITPQEQEELGWSEGLKYSYSHAKKNVLKTVFENIELAGIPVTNRNNLTNREGTAVEAPVKIKGENRWIAQLGDVCYIGSDAEPIVQHLTSGTSVSPLTGEEISGKVGKISAAYEFELITITDNTLVDNTYPVPGASCTGPYSGEIEATIDREFDIPQPAGASETILEGTLWNSTTQLVRGAIAEGKDGL